MVGSIASSPAVDLSTLPAPVLVAQPTYAERRADKLARLQALHTEFTALVASDPAVKLIEADSYDEQVLAQACNDMGKALLLAFAEGDNLDQLGAQNDVKRLVVTPATDTTDAVMESDAAYKQRIQMAPHRYSVAGPELAYVFHARSASGDISDASAVSPSPGEVVVTVLSGSGTGVPSAEVLAAVRTVLTDNSVIPMTDLVTVQAAQPRAYDIVAEIYPFSGPDADLILSTAQESLAAFLETTRKLGRDVACSAHSAALHVGNVQRVKLISPPDDIPIDWSQFPSPTSISVTIGGIEW